MELQLQVTEEELLEFPEVRHDQINTSYPDKPAGRVIPSIEKKSSHQNSSRSRGSCSADTHSKIKFEKPYYKRLVAPRRQLVGSKVCRTTKVYFDCRKQKDGQLPIHTPIDNVHTPSLFDIQVRPNLTAFAKTLTPEALRYLYLGIDLGRKIGNCPQ